MHCIRCIAIDCRGYGDTDKPSGIHNYDINVLADDISNLAKALKCDTFTLVGHDWGGMIGYQVCLRWVRNHFCLCDVFLHGSTGFTMEEQLLSYANICS